MSSVDYSQIGQISGKNVTELADNLYEAFESANVLHIFYKFGLVYLRKAYGKDLAMNAISDRAGFDCEHADPQISKAASMFIKRHENHLGRHKLRASLETHGCGAMRAGDLVFLVHECVKKDAKFWQISAFELNNGPSGDSVRDTIDEVVDYDGFGVYSSYVEYDEIEQLIDNCIRVDGPEANPRERAAFKNTI